MTQAPERPRTARPTRALPQVRRDGGAWLPALLLALRTTAYGLIGVELVVLVLWASATHAGSGAGAALRLGLSVWSAAHHATVHVGGASLGVVPYPLTVLPGWLLYRGTRRLLAADRGMEPLAFVPALAVCYGVLTAAVALAARGPLVRPAPADAFVGGAVLAVACAGAAELRVHGRPRWLRPEAAAVALAALRAAGLLLAGGLLLAAAAVLAAHRDVSTAASALHPGVSGAVGLLLLDVLAAGHLAADGASLLAGPGFGLGAHTSVSLAGATLGPVPALPVLAALPQSGPFPAYLAALLLVPLAVGADAGRRLFGGAAAGAGGRVRVLYCAGLGAAGALLMAAMAALADGSAGPGRLAVAGPSPWQVGLAAGGELALGALLVLAATDGVTAVGRRRARR